MISNDVDDGRRDLDLPPLPSDDDLAYASSLDDEDDDDDTSLRRDGGMTIMTLT